MVPHFLDLAGARLSCCGAYVGYVRAWTSTPMSFASLAIATACMRNSPATSTRPPAQGDSSDYGGSATNCIGEMTTRGLVDSLPLAMLPSGRFDFYFRDCGCAVSHVIPGPDLSLTTQTEKEVSL